MKTLWPPLARRLNALSLRERLIMAVSLAMALAAVVDMAVLSPQFAAQHDALAQLRTQQAALATLRAQVAEQVAAPTASSPSATLRQRLAAEQTQLQAVDAALAQRLGSGYTASLPALLQQVLRRHDKLTLLKLDTLPPAASAPAARRSVELQLAGRYADLLAYTQAIEQQLPGLRWATLHIDASPQPPVLSARVWLPGTTP